MVVAADLGKIGLAVTVLAASTFLFRHWISPFLDLGAIGLCLQPESTWLFSGSVAEAGLRVWLSRPAGLGFLKRHEDE